MALEQSAHALNLLRACATEHGFVAARTDRTNYQRIWSRDGCICGLAALLDGSDDLVDGFARTLDTLERHQGPSGQLPSNVLPVGPRVSYGGSAGRIDATTWWVLGCCLLGRLGHGDARLEKRWPAIERALAVLRAWEHNDAGLLWIPAGGDWADELPLEGHVLYDQALRLWALREVAAAADRLGRADHGRHVDAAERVREAVAAALVRDDGFLPMRHPACASPFDFDALGGSLCVGLGLGSEETRRSFVSDARGHLAHGLVPAFAPAIRPGDPAWPALERLASEHVRNTPGRYQNGGLWPMIAGFVAVAASCVGDDALVVRLLGGIRAANERGFPEYLDATDGAPGGVQGQAWSAAGEALAAYSAGAGAGSGAAGAFFPGFSDA